MFKREYGIWWHFIEAGFKKTNGCINIHISIYPFTTKGKVDTFHLGWDLEINWSKGLINNYIGWN